MRGFEAPPPPRRGEQQAPPQQPQRQAPPPQHPLRLLAWPLGVLVSTVALLVAPLWLGEGRQQRHG